MGRGESDDLYARASAGAMVAVSGALRWAKAQYTTPTSRITPSVNSKIGTLLRNPGTVTFGSALSGGFWPPPAAVGGHRKVVSMGAPHTRPGMVPIHHHSSRLN